MRSEPYSVDRLTVLLRIHETGSLSAAADEMHMSPSALSQQITKLEREVGLALVFRHHKGMQLTDAGVTLTKYASTINNALAAARNEMDEFAQLRRGHVRLATFPTFAASIMPKVLRRFHARHPELSISVTSCRREDIRQSLERRDVDLATLWDYPWSPVSTDPGWQSSTLMQEPTKLILPTSHALARRRVVDLAEVADDPWITRSSHPVSSVLQRICGEAGFEPNVVFEANDYPELIGMVAAGIGVALAPSLATVPHTSDVRITALRGNPAPRRISLARLPENVPSPAVHALSRIFRDVCREENIEK